MPKWKVAGPGGRFLQVNEKGTWTADRITHQECVEQAGRPVPMTPTGPLYMPTGLLDEAWLYLQALRIIPGPVTVTGTPPDLPRVTANPGAIH